MISTFVLLGQPSPHDVARPSICCPKGILLSFDRAAVSLCNDLRAFSPMVFDHHREHSEGLKRLLTKRSHSYRIKPLLRRYSRGVIPTILRKMFEKCPW